MYELNKDNEFPNKIVFLQEPLIEVVTCRQIISAKKFVHKSIAYSTKNILMLF